MNKMLIRIIAGLIQASLTLSMGVYVIWHEGELLFGTLFIPLAIIMYALMYRDARDYKRER